MKTEQNAPSGQAVAKTRRSFAAVDTVAYWKARLFKNTYTGRDGQVVEQAEWSVRLQRDGKRRSFKLSSSNKERAAEEARDKAVLVLTKGWDAVLRPKASGSPTVDEFCGVSGDESQRGIYEAAAEVMEKRPRVSTRRAYVRKLRQLCALAKVTRIQELDQNAIERAKESYRAAARKQKRSDDQIQNSLTSMITNAAACFSKEALGIYERRGYSITNPFDGLVKRTSVKPVAPLPAPVVEAIWRDLPLLRDGDPKAPDPEKARTKRTYRRAFGTDPRWLPTDFRQPQPGAYCAVLLALGAGMRANEIDKARRRWFSVPDKAGEPVLLTINAEHDFKPKGGTLRAIKIPRELYDAVAATWSDLSSEYVIGGDATESVLGYRKPEVFRAASAWLRARGVEAKSPQGGKPLHALRKQFGSEIATSYGLFAAQKLLGHSDPATTARYYAATTDLPAIRHVRLG